MSELTYVGNGVYRERRYLDRQPEVGDKIVYIHDGLFADYPVGSEGVVVSPKSYTGHTTLISMNRSKRDDEYIPDEWFVICEDIYRKLSHKEVEVKRFLGIPIGKKTTYIWKEETL